MNDYDDVPITATDRVALRGACVRLFPQAADRRAVLDELGFPQRWWPSDSEPAEQAWRSVFDALDDGILETTPFRRLLAAVVSAAGDDPQVRQLAVRYRLAAGRSRPTVGPRRKGAGDGTPGRFRGRRRRGALALAAVSLAVAAVLVVAALVVLDSGGGDADEVGGPSPVATSPTGPTTSLLDYEVQLEDPSAAMRRAAVLGVVELGRAGGADESCDVLERHVERQLTWDEESDQHQGTNIEQLDVRSPDGAAALTGLSDLRCAAEVSMQVLDLRNCYLESADLRAVAINYSHLGNASLDFADLTAANFTDNVLHDSRIRNATLVGAVLVRTDLQRVRLTGSDLTRADLSGADLAGADLDGATLDGAVFAGATADGTTRWPNGFDPVAAGVTIS